MKSAAIPAEIDPAISMTGRRRFVSDFAELVKARLTLLVLLTTAVGYYLGADGPINPLALFHAVFGTALAAAGAAALNQWWERRLDALMHRTKMKSAGSQTRSINVPIGGGRKMAAQQSRMDGSPKAGLSSIVGKATTRRCSCISSH